MNMTNLKTLISDNEDFLIEKILNYAKERNYVKYTSTLKEAWRMSVSGLSKAFLKVIESNNSIPEMSPDDDFTKSDFAKFGIIEAQKHRSRGVTLSMFLSLMKYYHQSYTDLVNESNLMIEEKEYFTQYIKRFFDHIELGFVEEWTNLSDKLKLEELQKSNREMTNEKNKYLTIFESMYDPIILVDKDNNIENINYKASEIFFNEAVSGMKYYGKINTDKELGWLSENLFKFVNSNKNELLDQQTIETKTGEKIFLTKFKKMLDVSGKYEGTVIKFSDITERIKIEKELKKQHEKLEFYAFTDPMTEVSNRRTGLMILEKELSMISMRNKPLSVCFIDVDGLKLVNDNYGHNEGDLLINFIASSIKSSIRAMDTVSRIGGDEFLIIFPALYELDAKESIKNICNKLEEFNKKAEKPFKYSFSYGIIEISKAMKLNANEVIKAADEKMYKNKLSKKVKL